MSALKRKQETGKSPGMSSKKRQKIEPGSKDESRKGADTSITKTPPQKSVLLKEEPAFPRGGAGPLTLLEQKRIRAKATRDVAREAQDGDLFNGQNGAADDSADSDLDLSDLNKKETFAKKKSKKATKVKTGKETDAAFIESVSHKRLADGSLLLGRISNISSKDLTISLPNNLSGYVPLTAISKAFNSKIEKVLQESDNDEEEDEEEDNTTDLHKHFKVGSYLRVSVLNSAKSSATKGETQRRIDLSIEPSIVNGSLTRSILAPGVTIQAAVTSVEDHGVIVDLGLQDGSTGFIAKKALPQDTQSLEVQIGSVLLCYVIGVSFKGKAVQLSADTSSAPVVKSASSVDAYLPGTLAEVLLTHVTEEGLAGKVLGLLDVTADVLHSSAFRDRETYEAEYKVGQKVKGRLIANFPSSNSKKLAFSVLDELVELKSGPSTSLPLSSVVERARVISVVPRIGVYFALPSDAMGFAHISRLSDKTVETLSESSGAFKIGSEHRARIVDYNTVDNICSLSLQKSILEQPFLRLEDVEAGNIVHGTIEKVLVGEKGIRGLLVKLAPGIVGHVSSIHLSDATLKNPEKKFREGLPIKARVLSVNTNKRRLDLTLKKTLVNSDQPVWSHWDSLNVGNSTVGTIIKLEANGALLEFYGGLKGRLPVSEMSEAFVKDAREHFKLGQVLTVHILSIDYEKHRLILSARDPATNGKNDTSALEIGSMVNGVVFEKSADDVLLRLEPNGAIARLPLNHIIDGSEKKRKSALEKIRVGQNLENVLVLNIRGRQIILTNKASMKIATQQGQLLKSFEDLKEDTIVTGFVSNITDTRVFVQFAAGITGVINQAQMPDDKAELPDFDMKVMQAVSARVVRVDYSSATPRFWLSMKTSSSAQERVDTILAKSTAVVDKEIVEPVDDKIKSFNDLTLGTVVKVRVTSIKETQLNVEIAKGIQGRVDVSEIFDELADIKDRKHPLRQFSVRQTLDVRVIGQHDSRTYKFLPLSHRTTKNVVFELSARPSALSNKQRDVLRLEDMQVGQSHIVFVNNVADHSLMVNVSPAVRGRIRATDVADDLTLATNLAHNFPVGSALKAKVTAVDVDKNRLDLSAKTGSAIRSLTIDEISAGDIVTGRITKRTDRSVIVQLGESLVGAVELVDMADDYDMADPTSFRMHEVVRAYVLQVDQPNKRVYLSLRPSKILSSALETKDPEVSLKQLKVGDIRRGFVANVAEKGVFIEMARGLRAFVRITNLSDEYLKDWKSSFQRDQLVQGKIIAVDKDSSHVQMSLRKSHFDKNYRPPVSFNDLHVGDVVEGKIAKIEPFGVFVLVANSENVRGLCHRSEIAEKRIEDATKLGFNEGDTVKAKVLKIDPEQRRVNFGMKASYFADAEEAENSDNEDDEVASEEDQEVSNDEEVELDVQEDAGSDDAESLDDDSEGVPIDLDSDQMDVDEKLAPAAGLSVGGFDWFGMPLTSKGAVKRPAEESDTEDKSQQRKKKKKKPEVLVDRTGDLDKDGPQSVDDFERLLLSEPYNSQLWVQFMAFHIELGDIDQAREVCEKALRSIGTGQEDEKRMVYVALLNLENAFGDDESVEATLQRACQTNDPQDMHSRLASIYIQSGKREKADELFHIMSRKFTQDPKLWVNHAQFLFDTMEDAPRARALLPRALQALPPIAHFDITSKFAQLEFKTKTGVPEEGRTRFQGLVSLYPKRLDLFNVMLDMEMKLGDKDQIRGVFEQVLSKKLKPVQAKKLLSRWLAYEKKEGDAKMVEEVETKAAKWVASYQKQTA